MYKGKSIGVVVPAYNEERFIVAVIDCLPEYIDKVYVIDDGSVDNTFMAASGVTSRNGNLKVIKHVKNRGVGASIVTGYKNSMLDRMDVSVVMAGDNQMDPAQLPCLLAPIVAGEADYIKGDRTSNGNNLRGMTYWRRFGNLLLRWLTRVASGCHHLNDPQNGYTAISIEMLRKLNLDDIYPWYGYCNDMLVKLNVGEARILEVPMPARYQFEKSGICYVKYIPRISMLLLREFFWRLKMKYLRRK